MAYRIRYGARRKNRWWLLAGGALAAAALTKGYWYWEFARYVGRMIHEAH